MTEPQKPNPLTDPYGAMMLAKPKKSQNLGAVAKEAGFADEKGRLEDIQNAALLHQKNLAEYDQLVESTLSKLTPFLGQSQKFVYLKTNNERLATLWLGKWLPLGRVGVSHEGRWEVTNDRDEIEAVENGTQAITKLLEYLAPTFKENEKARVYEANRQAMQLNQDLHNKEVRRRMSEEDGYSPAMTAQQLAQHDLKIAKAKAAKA
jgi:hypothetical protein